MKPQNNNTNFNSQNFSNTEKQLLERIEQIEKKLDQNLENTAKIEEETQKTLDETHKDLIIDMNQEDALSKSHQEEQAITKQLHQENQNVIKQVHQENQEVTHQLHEESQKLSQEMHKQAIRVNWIALTISIILSIVISVGTVFIFFRENFSLL